MNAQERLTRRRAALHDPTSRHAVRGRSWPEEYQNVTATVLFTPRATPAGVDSGRCGLAVGFHIGNVTSCLAISADT